LFFQANESLESFEQELDGAFARKRLLENLVIQYHYLPSQHKLPIRYIVNRTLKDGKSKDNLSTRLHRILESVLQQESYSEERYRDALESLVGAVTQHHSVTASLHFLDESWGLRLKTGEDDLSKDIINAAALLGIPEKFDEIEAKFMNSLEHEWNSRSDETAIIDSPLVLAAMGNQQELLTRLLDAREAFGLLPAHSNETYHAVVCAESRGHEKIVSLLFDPKYGNDTNSWAESELLKIAASQNHQFLLRGLHHRLGLKASDTVLGLAAFYGHEDLVKTSLENGADPNAYTLVQAGALRVSSPLCAAAGRGYVNIVRLLLSHGADPSNGHALCYAASYGYQRTVQLLLDASGIPVTAAWLSPLTRATRNGQAHIVKLLLDRGLDIKNEHRKAADMSLETAAGRGFETIVRILIDHGVSKDGPEDVNEIKTCSPMMMALKRGHPHIVDTLLELGAKAIGPLQSTHGDEVFNGKHPLPWEYGVKPVFPRIVSNETAS
jgi:ankyrin repeat protein